MQTEAAIFRKTGEPLSIETVDVDAPWPHEVLVRTEGSGVCHSELLHLDGLVGDFDPPPMVMGHEGAGTVIAVGAEVEGLAPGDHVVACSKAFCGTCQQCLSGHPNLCLRANIKDRPPSAPARITSGGETIRQFGGVSSHAGLMLLHESTVVKIDQGIPLDRAALLGCGVLTGLGAVLWTSGLKVGQTVAVFGCGGVGLSAIQGARIGGARQIIALDRVPAKLELARTCGATDVVNVAEADAVEAIRDLTGGAGVDHALEMVGSPALVRQAVASLAVRGTATMVGILPAGSTIELPGNALFAECRLQTSRMGSTRYRIDIPRYLELYAQGRLLLDELITGRELLGDVNRAFAAMRAGTSARTVLVPRR
jgi:S-(hydroxymethyl)glutathione dehydrogenase / alcohol dehydrogenase